MAWFITCMTILAILVALIMNIVIWCCLRINSTENKEDETGIIFVPIKNQNMTIQECIDACLDGNFILINDGKLIGMTI